MTRLSLKARKLILGFCLLLAISCVGNIAEANNVNPMFIIKPADNVFADSAKYYLESFYDDISIFLNFELDTTVTLYIADSEQEFKDMVGSEFPD